MTGRLATMKCGGYPEGTDLIVHSGSYVGRITIIELALASVVGVGICSGPGAIVPHLKRGDDIVPILRGPIVDIGDAISRAVAGASVSIDVGGTTSVVGVYVPGH